VTENRPHSSVGCRGYLNRGGGRLGGGGGSSLFLSRRRLLERTSDHPLFLITYPDIAHCVGACSAKEAVLSSSLSPLSVLSPLYTVLHIPHTARLLRRWGRFTSTGAAAASAAAAAAASFSAAAASSAAAFSATIAWCTLWC
jgi:hypothetical protein